MADKSPLANDIPWAEQDSRLTTHDLEETSQAIDAWFASSGDDIEIIDDDALDNSQSLRTGSNVPIVLFCSVLLIAAAAAAGLWVSLSGEPEQVADDGTAFTVVLPESTATDPLALNTEIAVSWDPPGEATAWVWNLSVGSLRGIPTDTTAPEGMVFAGFDVQMTLVDVDTTTVTMPTASRLVWDVIGGATNEVYTQGEGIGSPCGKIDGELLRPQLFEGGSVSGVVCLAVPVEDLAHPDTVIAARSIERAYFGAGGTVASATDVPPAEDPIEITRRDGGRSTPFAFDEAQTIDFSERGGVIDSVWTLEFTAPQDITDFVRADGVPEFNPELRDGFVFAGVDIDATLETAGAAEMSFSPYVQIEIFGGASGVVFQARSLPNGCGPVTSQFFAGSEVAIGGRSTGLVCMQIRAEDVGHPNTRVALTFFDGSRVFFG